MVNHSKMKKTNCLWAVTKASFPLRKYSLKISQGKSLRPYVLEKKIGQENLYDFYIMQWNQ